MATTVFYGIFIIVIIVGGFAAVFPERTVALRQRFGFSTSLLSGGWFYATPERARVTGAVVAVIGCIIVLLGPGGDEL